MKNVVGGWRGARGHGAGRYTVADEIQFEQVLKRLIQLYAHGNERKAAKEMGIPPETLYRLCRRRGQVASDRQPTALSHLTAQRLEAAARAKSEALARRLLIAILSPYAMRLWRDDFLKWCLERRDRFVYRVKRYQGRRYSYLHILESRVHGEFAYLITAFSARMAKRNVSTLRQEVALRRVIEPLAESCESGFIERQWGELAKAEKQAFLQAGIRREEIMLRR